MKSTIEGRARRLGNSIGVNQIYPERYNGIREPNEMRAHLFEDLDPDFSKETCDGDIIVAGRLFGLGPRSESAVLALKESGIACIIADSFDRLFYREALNHGLVVLEQPEAINIIKDGEPIQVDLEGAEIRCRKGLLKFHKHSEPVMGILKAGGLLPYVKNLISRK